METIEQTLDNWLEEYSANKKLLNRLTSAKEQITKNNSNDYSIFLDTREILVLSKGLTKILQSNKESIMDCSYNIIQARKNKDNAEQIIEDNTYLEQTNNTLEEVKQENKTKEEKPIEKTENTSEKENTFMNKIDKVFKQFAKPIKIINVFEFDKLLSIFNNIDSKRVQYLGKSFWILFRISQNYTQNEEHLISLVNLILEFNNLEEAKIVLKGDCKTENCTYMFFATDLVNNYKYLREFIEKGGTIILCTDEKENLDAIQQIKEIV